MCSPWTSSIIYSPLLLSPVSVQPCQSFVIWCWLSGNCGKGSMPDLGLYNALFIILSHLVVLGAREMVNRPSKEFQFFLFLYCSSFYSPPPSFSSPSPLIFSLLLFFFSSSFFLSLLLTYFLHPRFLPIHLPMTPTPSSLSFLSFQGGCVGHK